jgi:antitoxin (DNA-binding transcriptional repressor) of toxin-antitoxin stability system
MRFIAVEDMVRSPQQAWKGLPDERETVITKNGRPIALLTPVTDRSLEGTLAAVRQARATQAVASMQQDARRGGSNELTEKQISDEIRAARIEKGG